ncbi:hypothetical protein [Roseomonas sp. AR75]|uniref:hypothetical protein n=1 Tax=Roseomonas sp. AR75 TaxID=2562311 RepID=UPI0010BF9723|nr:hypothetical protein [Roseomonas sp. AR75]
MTIVPTTTTQYFWFGTRSVDFALPGPSGEQLEYLTSNEDFATRTYSNGTTVDFTGSEWKQFLAFTGTAEQMAALGVNVLDGSVDTALAGQVNTTGDLRVGEGVVAYNIADLNGGRLVDTTGTLDDSDDPFTITGLARSGPGKLDTATMEAADTGNRIMFSDGVGFGVIGNAGFDPGGNASRLNNGESINFEVKQGKQLLMASFTVRVNGAETAVIIDSDGATIDDTNGDLQGGFVQDDSAGELNLGVLADGTKVTINYENETIWIDGNAFVGDLGDIVAFFDAFQAAGSNDLTIGSVFDNAVGWSADDLVLAADVVPDTIPPLPTANAMISFEIDTTAPDRGLYATLDIGKNGVDARELLSTSSSDFFFGSDPNADPMGNLNGTDTPLNIFDLTVFGQFDSRIGLPDRFGNTQPGDPDFQQQEGGLRSGNGGGSVTGGGLVVDSGSNAVAEDGTPYQPGGNYGDEGTGNREFNNGEIMRFELGSSFAGVSALLDFKYEPDSHDGMDVVVRLFSGGTLVEQVAIDLDDGLGLADRAVSGAGTFDTLEIVALVDAASNLALTDLDIDAIASFTPGAADSYDRIRLDVRNDGVNELVDRAGDGQGFINTGANPEYHPLVDGVIVENLPIGDVFTYFTLDGDPTDVRWRKPEGIYSTGDGDNNRDIDGPNGAVTISLKTGASLPDDGDSNLLDDQLAFAFGGTLGFTAFGNGETANFEFYAGGNLILETSLLNNTGSNITSVNLDDLTGYDGQAFDTLRVSAPTSADQFNLQDITFNVFAF